MPLLVVKKKCEKAKQLGADHTCNNRTTDVAAWVREKTGGEGVNLVFDHVGEALWETSLFSLAPRGRLVNLWWNIRKFTDNFPVSVIFIIWA